MADNTTKPLRILLKTALLFLLVNVVWALLTPDLGFISVYNHIVPGRTRFPFGEVPDLAYNFSLDNLNAMFASHEIESSYMEAQYSVFVVGDSSVWGTLLTPEETLSGQLNQLKLTHQPSGLPIRFYNLGYPTLSLTKDIMVIDEALQPYEPDLVIWMVTLESMPWELQQRSPIVKNNPERLYELKEWYGFPIEKSNQPIALDSFWEKTLIGQRREIADVLRLQVYGFLWQATGIDQYYPEEYTPAAWDLAEDESYYDFVPDSFSQAELAFELIEGALELAEPYETEFLVVNEPILLSKGANSDIRYNFYYPRWAYDQYRGMMEQQASQHHWNYLDLWNIIPPEEFTNSAIHLTPQGELLLANAIAASFVEQGLWSVDD